MDGTALRDLRTRFGLTQREVAAAAGIRQPDLSGIENGNRGSAETRRRVHAAIRSLVRPRDVLTPDKEADVRSLVAASGGTDIRIFGSVARGEDRTGGDLDLMARFPQGFDLVDLMELEEAVETLLGIPVDLVADDARAPYALSSAKAEAVPL